MCTFSGRWLQLSGVSLTLILHSPTKFTPPPSNGWEITMHCIEMPLLLLSPPVSAQPAHSPIPTYSCEGERGEGGFTGDMKSSQQLHIPSCVNFQPRP